MFRTLVVVLVSIWGVCPMDIWYQWRQLDFEFPSGSTRQSWVNSGAFQPINTFPMDADYSSLDPNERTFITVPKFKPGVPATLATVVPDANGNPVLRPYPSWNVNTRTDCSGLLSVLRIKISECGQLWVLDSGRVNISSNYAQVCPAKLRVYNLSTDQLIQEYVIPTNVLSSNSLMGTIELQGNCQLPYVYLADIVGQAIVVLDTSSQRFWRVANRYTQADPNASNFSINGERFQLSDGTISIASTSSSVYFHSLASFTEEFVPVSVLNNYRNFQQPGDSANQFQESSGRRTGQSGPADIAQGGSVMLFSNLPEDSLYCWRTGTSYEPKNLYKVFQNNITFQFPTGLKIIKDNNNREYILVFTTRFQANMNNRINPNDINYRLLYTAVDDLVAGYPCSRYYK